MNIIKTTRRCIPFIQNKNSRGITISPIRFTPLLSISFFYSVDGTNVNNMGDSSEGVENGTSRSNWLKKI